MLEDSPIDIGVFNMIENVERLLGVGMPDLKSYIHPCDEMFYRLDNMTNHCFGDDWLMSFFIEYTKAIEAIELFKKSDHFLWDRERTNVASSFSRECAPVILSAMLIKQYSLVLKPYDYYMEEMFIILKDFVDKLSQENPPSISTLYRYLATDVMSLQNSGKIYQEVVKSLPSKTSQWEEIY